MTMLQVGAAISGVSYVAGFALYLPTVRRACHESRHIPPLRRRFAATVIILAWPAMPIAELHKAWRGRRTPTRSDMPPDPADAALAESEQLGQEQRPRNTPMPEGQHD